LDITLILLIGSLLPSVRFNGDNLVRV